MYYFRLALSVVTIILATLSLVNIVSMNIALPIVLSLLSISNFIVAYESFKNSKKVMGGLSLFTAIFILFVVIYTTLF